MREEVGIQSLRLGNNVAGPASLQAPALSLHLILQCASVPEKLKRRAGSTTRFTFVLSRPNRSGWAPEQPGCRGSGPLPSSRPRPKQCRLPLPLAFIRRVTWQPPLETSPSSPSLPPGRSSNRPFARQLDGWGGGEVWAWTWAWAWAREYESLSFGMQDLRIWTLHTYIKARVTRVHGDGVRHRSPNQWKRNLQGPGRSGRGKTWESRSDSGRGGRVIPTVPEPGPSGSRCQVRPGAGGGGGGRCQKMRRWPRAAVATTAFIFKLPSG